MRAGQNDGPLPFEASFEFGESKYLDKQGFATGEEVARRRTGWPPDRRAFFATRLT